LKILRKEDKERSEPSPSRSVTATFLRNLSSKSGAHPRGETTRRSSATTGHNDDFSDSDTDRSYELEFSDNEDASFDGPAAHEVREDLPLTFNAEARAAYKTIKSAKVPNDIKEKAADFIADRLMFGSSYVHDMLTGNTPWPKFSKQELFNNCRKVAQLLENVRMREELGKELSEKARKRMLQGESEAIRDIRTSIHIARLGPVEGKEYRESLTTEAARQDFEATFADPKAFKWYMRSLAEVKKKGSSARRAPASSSFSGGTGPFRPPRRSRGSRGNR
jgi:hypothetical protein